MYRGIVFLILVQSAVLLFCLNAHADAALAGSISSSHNHLRRELKRSSYGGASFGGEVASGTGGALVDLDEVDEENPSVGVGPIIGSVLGCLGFLLGCVSRCKKDSKDELDQPQGGGEETELKKNRTAETDSAIVVACKKALKEHYRKPKYPVPQHSTLDANVSKAAAFCTMMEQMMDEFVYEIVNIYHVFKKHKTEEHRMYLIATIFQEKIVPHHIPCFLLLHLSAGLPIAPNDEKKEDNRSAVECILAEELIETFAIWYKFLHDKASALGILSDHKQKESFVALKKIAKELSDQNKSTLRVLNVTRDPTQRSRPLMTTEAFEMACLMESLYRRYHGQQTDPSVAEIEDEDSAPQQPTSAVIAPFPSHAPRRQQVVVVAPPADKLGIIFFHEASMNGNRPTVKTVSSDSPLYGEVQEGDVVLSVNFVNVESRTPRDLVTLIKSNAGEKRYFILERKNPSILNEASTAPKRQEIAPVADPSVEDIKDEENPPEMPKSEVITTFPSTPPKALKFIVVAPPADKLGIIFVREASLNGNRPTVKTVSSDSPLYGKVKEGDVVLSVNFVNVESKTTKELVALIKSKAGEERDFILERKNPSISNEASVAPLTHQVAVVAPPADKLGIIFFRDASMNGNRPTVKTVRSESPLYGKVQEGDVVLSVDFVNVESKSPADLVALIQSNAGKERCFILERKNPSISNAA